MIKKILLSYWLIIGFLKKHTKLLLFCIFLGLLISFLFPKIYDFLPRPKTFEKIAVIGRPNLSDIPLFIQKEISLGLVDISRSGEPLPSIAVSFTTSDDGKHFNFILRNDLYWHDGKKFSAEDINYHFSDVEMKVVSSNEIEFFLKEPFSPFPTIVSQPIFRQNKGKIFKKNISLIGLGEMRVQKISRNGNLITELLLSSASRKILYRFYNTQESAILAFKLGEVDKILELSSTGDISNHANTTVEEVIHKNRYVALFFNNQDSYLQSKTFRQALAYAIPTKPDDESRTISPINPDSWAYNPQVKNYNYDLEAAKRLLNSEKEGQENFNPKIVISTTVPYLDIAEKIKEEWIKLDIETSVKVTSYLPEEFQTLLIAQEIPPDPDQYSFWHSTQPTNITKYNSPKVDKLLEEGRQILDKNERTIKYQDFQRFLAEDVPAVFLYNHKTYTITRS